MEIQRTAGRMPQLDVLFIANVGKDFGVPYGNRTRVTAVKEKGPIVIQRNFAAWIALYRT
jgi:hypothetical protein